MNSNTIKIINVFLVFLKLNNSSYPIKDLLQYKDEELMIEVEKNSPVTALEEFFYNSSILFNENEKAKYGVTYTPSNISDFMSKILLDDANIDSKIIDPSMGSGALLYSTAKLMKDKLNLPYKDIVENNLYGVDIKEENIFIAKLLFSYLVWEESRELPRRMNFILNDALLLNRKKIIDNFKFAEFDYCIVNPPYIRSKNLSKETKEIIRERYVTSKGVTDIYIPFFEVTLNILKSTGKAVLITHNSFLTTNNGENLRMYIEKNAETILFDLSNMQTFDGKLTYSIISLMRKINSSYEAQTNIFYVQNTDLLDTEKMLDSKNWQRVKVNNKWYLLSENEIEIIRKIETSFNTKLNDLNYKNGVATLRNNIYSFEKLDEDEKFYFFAKNNINEKIEKGITKPFVLPNKSIAKNLRIIFPYLRLDNGDIVPIEENSFKSDYPLCYQYLKRYKSELDKRDSDKGMKNWYEYGRSQGLKDKGNRIYLPYIAQRMCIRRSKYEDEIFAAGYAIFSENENCLRFLKALLESNLITYYVFKTSKPYSSNYYSTAKNVLKNISIPTYDFDKDFTEEELYAIYGLNDVEIEKIEKFIYDNDL